MFFNRCSTEPKGSSARHHRWPVKKLGHANNQITISQLTEKYRILNLPSCGPEVIIWRSTLNLALQQIYQLKAAKSHLLHKVNYYQLCTVTLLVQSFIFSTVITLNVWPIVRCPYKVNKPDQNHAVLQHVACPLLSARLTSRKPRD